MGQNKEGTVVSGVRVSAQSDFLGDVCYDVTGNITSCKLFQPHISHSTLEKYYLPLVCLTQKHYI